MMLAVLEKAGFQINLVEGNIENSKITFHSDFVLPNICFIQNESTIGILS